MLDHGEEGSLAGGSGFFRGEVLQLRAVVARLDLQIH